MGIHDLPLDRLATTDETGKRVYLYPADTRGRHRERRSLLSAALIVVFLALPWLRIGGHQAILLDIPNRRFAILGMTFWAHDAPMLVFVFGGAALLLFFVTAVWGRVWCGWACPQTVFVDSVFRRIERAIEGDAVARRRLDAAPLSGAKAARKAVKWLLFAAAALVISHSFLAYFVGTEALEAMVRSSPSSNLSPFIVMAAITGGVLFDFGWFREQFCTIVCPYGRVQSVLMDDRSQVVLYDRDRGEPRRGTAAPGQPQGDCVNCYRCVQVCPTGIDIRRGLQMECVACTACIDACDEIMAKLRKPAGLIRYGSAASAQGGKSRAGASARSWIYGILVAVFASGLAYTLETRSLIEVELTRAAEAPYQEIPGANGPEVINHFKLDLRNQSFEPRRIAIKSDTALVVSNHQDTLPPGERERADLFLRFPKSRLVSGHGHAIIEIESGTIGTRQEVRLVGPFN